MDRESLAVQDAREMGKVLRSAECMKRYSRISHDILAELLVSICLQGNVVGGNKPSTDVLSDEYGIVEVKSRILGTDGEYPRVSLRDSHVETADWICAVRWQKNFEFHDAVMVPKKSAAVLFHAKRQTSGLAHITWADWKSDTHAISLRSEINLVLQSHSTVGGVE